MTYHDGQIVTFKVPAAGTAHIRVYNPIAPFGENDKPRFMVPLWREYERGDGRIPPELAQYLIFGRNGYHAARTLKRPEVIYSDVDRLVRELARWDARNLPRDRIFAGHALECKVEIQALPTEGHTGRYLADHFPRARYQLRPLSVTIMRGAL